ncbi:MAG: pirin family protein [Oscillatoriaceae bacterium SKW80]|nr:pirin family protein [Oscillatoriaceae bacterium SKYG93]MCX8120852.1 pirin family protein [Oscillatoriaceae bacterium SKW80]MDW8454193.1 pirin family protein [Oscillatoriaceae cyanobacterium SKYGB_i_bin93]HIK26482.1 pirin family protein [Oscillatoriaceae cyanobacterium M7585_C2015_266]
MITIRKAEARGYANYGGIESYHTFSFANYYHPEYMGFRKLRVINEDIIQAGKGFGNHPHRDMEIISYVIKGCLEHKDNMGNNSLIRPGEVQKMSAGSGIVHSEYNHSKTECTHFLQIWILPDKKSLPPSYEQKMYSEEEKRGRLRIIASQNGREGSVKINQDVDLFASLLDVGQQVEYQIKPNRYAWVQVVKGAIAFNEQVLSAGDGAAVSHENRLVFEAKKDAEFLLFDLA